MPAYIRSQSTVDVARISAAHEVGQKEVDDGFRCLRRNGRLGLAVTNESTVRCEPHDHRVDRSRIQIASSDRGRVLGREFGRGFRSRASPRTAPPVGPRIGGRRLNGERLDALIFMSRAPGAGRQHEQQRPLPPWEHAERARGVHLQFADGGRIRHEPELTIGRHTVPARRPAPGAHRSCDSIGKHTSPASRGRSPTSHRRQRRLERRLGSVEHGRPQTRVCCRAASPSKARRVVAAVRPPCGASTGQPRECLDQAHRRPPVPSRPDVVRSCRSARFEAVHEQPASLVLQEPGVREQLSSSPRRVASSPVMCARRARNGGAPSIESIQICRRHPGRSGRRYRTPCGPSGDDDVEAAPAPVPHPAIPRHRRPRGGQQLARRCHVLLRAPADAPPDVGSQERAHEAERLLDRWSPDWAASRPRSATASPNAHTRNGQRIVGRRHRRGCSASSGMASPCRAIVFIRCSARQNEDRPV